jgi:hypothetical protein
VGPPTLEAQLLPDIRSRLKGAAYYCINPSCRTAYFTGWGAGVPATDLASPAYPKDENAPICPCFGLRAEEVVADALNGQRDRVRSLVERAKGPEAKCLSRCPDGRPCVARVLRLYRERFEERRPLP